MAKIADNALTVGCFDLLHSGHVNLFNEMRKLGKRVVVIVHDDRSIYENKQKFPVQTLEHRMLNIELTGLVDEIHVVREADPSGVIETMLHRLQGKVVYVRGSDWLDFPGRQVLEQNNVPIEIIKYTEGVSSTKLRDQL